jgi:hypothetical protein
MAKHKQQRKSKGKRTRVVMAARSGHLPMLVKPVVLIKTFRLRYLLTGNSGLTVAPFQIINSCFVTNQPGSVVRSVVDSIRLHFVEVWTPSIQGGSTAGPYVPQTVNVGFIPNSNIGDERFVSDTSMTVDPAHVKLRARAREASGMWQSSASNQQWTLNFGTLLASSVVDFVLDFRLNNSSASGSENNNVSVTTTPPAGSLAFINLVTTSNTQTSQWIPQGVLYTT